MTGQSSRVSASPGSDPFNYQRLKLVEKPDSPRNAKLLHPTLMGCEGHLQRLPLKSPNVDQKAPKTVCDMINICTDPDVVSLFTQAEANALQQGKEGSNARSEGFPSHVYHYTTSQLMREQVHAAKSRASHTRAPGVLGHVVYPGCISLYKRDGKTFAVPEGRWMLTSYKASWIAMNISLDQDTIDPENSQLLIIRVRPGSVGRIRDQGSEVLLDVGTHVFNSGVISNEGTARYSAFNHINHGRFNYIRVPRGKLARVWAEVRGREEIKSVQPRLLQEGEHFIDSHLFQYDGLSDVSDQYIRHGSIHHIAVEKGYIAKVLQDNAPRLLGEGDHVVESPNFEFKGMESIVSNPCIIHGTITILRVMLGSIALAWKDNEPTFLDKPGLFEFDSPDFSFVEFKDAEEQLIQLGAKKIILVHTGQVGVTYDKGKLKILTAGRHIVDSAVHVFHRFLSTQQKSIRLASLPAGDRVAHRQQIQNSSGRPPQKSSRSSGKASQTSGGYNSFSARSQRNWEDKDDNLVTAIRSVNSMVNPEADLTICETKDLVKVGLRADVFYSIEDPEKCIQKIDTDELEDLVRETAVATLTNIVRSTALNEIAQSKNISAGSGSGAISALQPPDSDDYESPPPPSAPTAVFFEKVHDEFLSMLHDDFMSRYGVDIANIRIESFKIMDTELSEQISKHALTTAQIENEMANLEGKSLISTTKERTSAEVKNISAEADAAAKKTIADAENQREVDAAKAAAESHKIATLAKAEAEAESILMKARAEAEAIRLKAAAEAERAEVLSRTTLGQQEALLTQYSEMVVESNRGIEKIVYLDPSVNRDSPFALGSLQNLNMDLHALSQLTIAANNEGESNRTAPEGPNHRYGKA